MTRLNKFPPGARLRKQDEFDRVFQNGSKIVTTNLVLIFLSNDTEKSRLGIVVSKKIGKAVKRNRVKRQVREIFRCHKHEINTGLDIIVIGRKGAAEAGIAKLREEMLSSFIRVNQDGTKE